MESLTDQDFLLWADALVQATPGRRERVLVGEFQREGHKTWQWRYNINQKLLSKELVDEEIKWCHMDKNNKRGSRLMLW